MDSLEKKFKDDIKKRIDETAKYILPNENTTDYAYMFIPADGLYQDLLNSRVGTLQINSKDLVSYAYTKNLWLPIALHFSWNFFQSLLGFNVSGQSMYSVLRISRDSPNLFNGGNFGFEGSILASILQIIAVVFIIYRYKNRESSITSIN